MRRLTVTIAIIAVILSVAAGIAAPRAVAFSSSFDGMPVRVKVARPASGGLTLTLTTTGAFVAPLALDPAYATLTLDGSGVDGKPGAPALPVVRRLIAVPEGADVVVTAHFTERTMDVSALTGRARLAPAFRSVEKLPSTSPGDGFVIDTRAFAHDGYRFREAATARVVGHLRGTRLTLIEARPIDYNPARGTLLVREDMRIDVAFPGADIAATHERRARYFDPRSGAILHGLLPPGGEDETVHPWEWRGAVTRASYLVIGDPLLASEESFAEFAAWKEQKGYDVVFLTTGEAGGEPEAIRETIRDAYETWDAPPAYVLLLGDVGQIPAFVGTDLSAPASDSMYALMDEDVFPDLAIGRFPARDAVQLANIVRKSLAHDRDVAPLASPLTAVFLASLDRAEITEGTHDYIIEHFTEPAGYRNERVYHARGATPNDVTDAVNEGPELLVYSGHGAENKWTDGPPYGINQIDKLENSAYPAVFSFACVTGAYDVELALSEAWVVAEAGGHAAWASSVNSFWDEDDILEKAMFEAFLGGKAPIALTWISGMTDYAKLALWQYLGGEGFATRYIEMYNLMGDPEQTLASRPPVAAQVTFSGAVADGALTVRLDAGRFAQVGITKDGEAVGIAYAQPGLFSPVRIDADLTPGDELLATITGPDLIPETRVLVVGEPFPDDVIPGADDDDDGSEDPNAEAEGGGWSFDENDDESSEPKGACGC
ncbi:hypothetical protein K8I61_04660 [bacterium]|nr:hypothetical protein [bacterium]